MDETIDTGYTSVRDYLGKCGDNPDKDIIFVLTLQSLIVALDNLRLGKPEDRSSVDRCWAITVTGMQKVLAMFRVWCCECQDT